MQPFLDAYLDGRTPSPCVDCNSTSSSVRCSAGRGACTTATRWRRAITPGRTHEIRRPGGAATDCSRARDPDKDQSYFLYGLRQDQLAHSRFPLGELTKPEVRDVARRHGLAPPRSRRARRSASCPVATTGDALRERAGWRPAPGPLLDSDGRQVGRARRRGRLHGRPAPGPRRRARRAALRRSHRCRREPRQLGRREDLARDAFVVRDRQLHGRVARRQATPSIARSASATARRRQRPDRAPDGRRARDARNVARPGQGDGLGAGTGPGGRLV